MGWSSPSPPTAIRQFGCDRTGSTRPSALRSSAAIGSSRRVRCCWPSLSADGHAIHYWLVDLDVSNKSYVRVAKDLYLTRFDGSGWGGLVKVNGDPITPSFVYDAPATADAHATGLVYPRPIVEGDTINAAHLEISEYDGSAWGESRLVEQNAYGNANRWPRLTPDGLHLVFDGGSRMSGQQLIVDTLWEMKTTTPPAGLIIFADGFESGDTSSWSSSAGK